MGTRNKLLIYLQVAVVLLLTTFNCALGQGPDEVLEVSFAENPVSPGGEAVLQCKVYGDIQMELVGISRYNNNGMNTIIFRNGDLLEDAPDHFSMNILPDKSDGSISYHVTITDIDYITDGGLYTCYALTVEGYVQAIATTRLDVTPDHLLPTCVSSKTGMTFSAESKITLTCMAEDSSGSTQWIRDDQIDVPEGQTTVRDGNTVVTSFIHQISESDDGVSFTCHVLTEDQRVDGDRYCSIGPIKVTNSTVVARQIAGLSVTIFAVVVTVGCVLFIVCVILLILFCRKSNICKSSSISRASHFSSKSYRMHGRPGSFTDSTLTRDGTVTGGRETFSYNPTRVAPPPPITSTVSTPRQSNGSTRPVSEQSDYEKRLSSAGLSDAEALLMATLLKKEKKGKNSRPTSTTSNETIYANTDQLHGLDPISEESHFGGVTNPGYEEHNGIALFADVATRKPPALQSTEPTEYYNTMELAAKNSANSRESPGVQVHEQAKPNLLPKVHGMDSNKPAPLAKHRSDNPPAPMAKPTTHSSGMPPSKPVPMPGITSNVSPTSLKPTPLPKHTQGASAGPTLLKPVSLLKPNKEVPSSPTKPALSSPTIKAPPPKPGERNSSMDFDAPLPNPPVVPAPPPKPSYDIMSDTRPTPPQKPTYNIMSDNKPPPPPKPTHDIMSDDKPPPPPKPTHDIMCNSKPLPPPKPVAKPRVNVNNRPPPPPKKPDYEI